MTVFRDPTGETSNATVNVACYDKLWNQRKWSAFVTTKVLLIMAIQSLTHFKMQEEIKNLQFTSLSTIQSHLLPWNFYPLQNFTTISR